MATTSTQPEASHEARDRFVSIPELVTIFLEQATTRTLVNCQRVCHTWNSIIENSDLLQQHLFLQAAPADTEPIINPIIEECFTILADSWNCYANGQSGSNLDSAYRRYSDLKHLSWARDCDLQHAPARRAFSREEGSWRDMLISQPPISRLDWWHVWTLEQFAWPGTTNAGWGHQDLSGTEVTIGMLWDLVEARMARGCGVRVLYFPKGKSMVNKSSSNYAWDWWKDTGSQQRGLTEDMPRVEIQSMQRWNRPVTGREVFDMNTLEWVGPKGTQRGRHDYHGDGFNVLRNDCRRDHEGACEGQLVDGREQNPLTRWSRSEGFALSEINGESSGSG